MLGFSRETPPVTASARIGVAYLFAIETAMRAGEICSLEWQYVNERHVHYTIGVKALPGYQTSVGRGTPGRFQLHQQ